MRFCKHVPTSPRNKNPKRLISYLLEKVVFLDPKKTIIPLLAKAKKYFSSTLNVMITQMVKNKIVRFNKYIDRNIKYKILWLVVLKLIPILHY
jgi:hypothetical protein